MSQGIVKGDFIVAQPELHSAFTCCIEFLGQLDQFVDHFLSSDGAVGRHPVV